MTLRGTIVLKFVCDIGGIKKIKWERECVTVGKEKEIQQI